MKFIKPHFILLILVILCFIKITPTPTALGNACREFNDSYVYDADSGSSKLESDHNYFIAPEDSYQVTTTACGGIEDEPRVEDVYDDDGNIVEDNSSQDPLPGIYVEITATVSGPAGEIGFNIPNKSSSGPLSYGSDGSALTGSGTVPANWIRKNKGAIVTNFTAVAKRKYRDGHFEIKSTESSSITLTPEPCPNQPEPILDTNVSQDKAGEMSLVEVGWDAIPGWGRPERGCFKYQFFEQQNCSFSISGGSIVDDSGSPTTLGSELPRGSRSLYIHATKGGDGQSPKVSKIPASISMNCSNSPPGNDPKANADISYPPRLLVPVQIINGTKYIKGDLIGHSDPSYTSKSLDKCLVKEDLYSKITANSLVLGGVLSQAYGLYFGHVMAGELNKDSSSICLGSGDTAGHQELLTNTSVLDMIKNLYRDSWSHIANTTPTPDALSTPPPGSFDRGYYVMDKLISKKFIIDNSISIKNTGDSISFIKGGSLAGGVKSSGQQTIVSDGSINITGDIVAGYSGDIINAPRIALMVNGNIVIDDKVRRLDLDIYATGSIKLCSSLACGQSLNFHGNIVSDSDVDYNRSNVEPSSKPKDIFSTITAFTQNSSWLAYIMSPPGVDDRYSNRATQSYLSKNK
jgi:hypothetical protein